jgi:hypothetical protein
MTSTQKLTLNVDGSTASFPSLPSSEADDEPPTLPAIPQYHQHPPSSASATTNVNSSSSADGSSKQLASKTSPVNGYDAFVDVDLTKVKFGDNKGRAQQLGRSGEDKDDEELGAADKDGAFCYSTPEHFVFWKFEVNRALLPLKLIMFCFYGGELFKHPCCSTRSKYVQLQYYESLFESLEPTEDLCINAFNVAPFIPIVTKYSRWIFLIYYESRH